jgi:hypothetical protein
VTPAEPRTRLNRTLWIAAAVAFLIFLIWYALRIFGAAEPTVDPGTAPAGGAGLLALARAARHGFHTPQHATNDDAESTVTTQRRIHA